MSAASACSRSSSATTPSGTWAVAVRYPSALSSRRKASTTSDWSSAMRTRGCGTGPGRRDGLVIHHPAVLQLHDAVAVLRILFRVGHLHDRRPLAIQGAEELHDLACLRRVQVAGRLVGQNELRLGPDAASNPDELLLPAGELVGVEILLPHDLEGIQDVGYHPLPPRAWRVAG